jgi:hypothetical protein
MAGEPAGPSRSVAGLGYDRVLALEGFPDGSDAPVYLSGSIVGPFANPWSDVDVYAVTDRDPIGPLVLEEGPVRLSQHFLDARRVDYEFWPPARVRALAERLAGLTLGAPSDIPRKRFTYAEECFIHRVGIGVPMLNADAFARYRVLFDTGKFCRYLAQEVVRETDGVYEDVCGMLEGGDLASAELSARRLVGLAVDAYLHACGNSDPNTKWRARQLEVMEDGPEFHADLRRRYWALEFPREAGPEAGEPARRRYVEECLELSRWITSWVQR